MNASDRPMQPNSQNVNEAPMNSLGEINEIDSEDLQDDVIVANIQDYNSRSKLVGSKRLQNNLEE